MQQTASPASAESLRPNRATLGITITVFGGLCFSFQDAGIERPMLLMLGAAIGWALVANATRILGETENTSTLLFYTLLGFAVIAQFCLTRAYAIAAPSLIAPFEYTALIWAVAIGYLLWGDIPDVPAMIGALLIVASGLYIIHREAMLHRKQRSKDCR